MEWLLTRSKIAQNYLRFWFYIDLVSCVPVDLILDYVTEDGGDGNLSAIVFIRFLKLMRLLKLLRVLRASQVIKRWRAHLSISNGIQLSMKLLSISCRLLSRRTQLIQPLHLS